MKIRPGLERRTSSARFTLVELLVVIAIIAMLAALLLPSLMQAKDQAWKAVCLGQQRQVGVGFGIYSSDFNMMIPGPQTRTYNYATSSNDPYVYWYSFYLGGSYPNYLSSRIIACPKNNGGSYGMYWWRNQSGMTDSCAYVRPNPYSSYDTYCRTWKIPEPGNYILLGCTSAASAWRPEFRNGSNTFVSTIFWGGGSWDQQGLWMAHGTVNCLFADGHVKSCEKSGLLSAANYRSLTNPDFAGGLRAWKTKDGVGITN